MKGRPPEYLAVGMRALMKVGSPVRRWMRTLEHRSEAWLTPVRYTLAPEPVFEPNIEPQYLEVTIARLMPPYAIVDHYDGHEWVRLWLDTREVHLFPASE